MQQTMRRLAAFVLSVALLAGLGVNPATAKSVDQGCETDAMLHDSVSDELCATEDSPIDDSRAAKSETKSTTNVEPRYVKPRNIEPRNIEPRNIEPRNIEPRNIEPRNIEPRNIEPRNIEPRNVEPRNIEPRNVEPMPRPIRTITEGQSTTFTVPTPRNRQELYCSPATTVYTITTVYVDGVPFSHHYVQNQARDRTLPCHLGRNDHRTRRSPAGPGRDEGYGAHVSARTRWSLVRATTASMS